MNYYNCEEHSEHQKNGKSDDPTSHNHFLIVDSFIHQRENDDSANKLFWKHIYNNMLTIEIIMELIKALIFWDELSQQSKRTAVRDGRTTTKKKHNQEK